MEFNGELLELMKKVTGKETKEGKPMKTININPGIIKWEEEDVIFKTDAGIIHGPDEEHRSSNYITASRGYNASLVDVVIVDDEYISIKRYESRSWNVFDTVANYEAEMAKRGGRVTLMCTPFKSSYSNKFAIDSQVRIYKDGKIATVYMNEFAGETVYFVENKPKMLCCTYVELDTSKPITAAENMEHFDGEAKFIRVTNEEEIKKYAYKLGTKSIKQVFPDLDSSCLAENRKFKRLAYWCSDELRVFSKDSQKKIENFFNFSNPGNAFGKEKLKSLTSSGTLSRLDSLMYWASVPKAESADPAMSKAETGRKLIEYVSPEWKDTDASKEEGIAVWARHEEWIVCGVVGGPATYWGYGHTSKKIFAYNTKNKVRFYGETNDDGKTWTFPIPGCEYISSAIILGEKKDYGKKPIKRKQIIKGDISLKELFAGSNVEWVLDNPEAMECETLSRNRDGYGDSHIKVKDELNEKLIGEIALHILVTTGNPALEMMLKSKLFNMYFYGIELLRDKKFGNTFLDLDKKKNGAIKKPSEYELKCAAFVYHSKEKNLKKMFGWNFNILRLVDEGCKWQEEERYGGKDFVRRVPMMYGVDRALGADITTLDMESVKEIVKLSKRDDTSTWYRRNLWVEIGELIIKNTPHCTPKVRLQYVSAYAGCIDMYKDYLNSRRQLVEYCEKHPGTVRCSEKLYPIKPMGAKKFIPYFSSLGFLDRYWGSTEKVREVSPKEFTEDLKLKYPDAFKEGRAEIIENEYTGISGCYIHLNPEEHVNFLHDETSQMSKFYNSDVDQKDFEKAMERVADYEWRNSEMGLEIVAPKFVRDITQEGAELDHCVGSYVNAILGGRENIVFLRRCDMPDSPYYTIELLQDRTRAGRMDIGEVHCFRNGNTSEADQDKAYKESGLAVYNKHFEIIKFLKKWCEAMGSARLNKRNIETGEIRRCSMSAIGGTER